MRAFNLVAEGKARYAEGLFVSAMGMSLAALLSRGLVAFLTTERNRMFVGLGFDWRVLGFTAGTAILTCVLFGLAPALRATRVAPAAVIRSSGRGVIGVDFTVLTAQIQNSLMRDRLMAALAGAVRAGNSKSTALTLLWSLTVQDKCAGDEQFLEDLRLIEGESTDERHYVKKGVNMALRAIGKRNRALNRSAVATARRLADSNSAAAKWVGADALRELTSDRVMNQSRG